MKTKRFGVLIVALIGALNISLAQDSQAIDGCRFALEPHVGIVVSNLSGADLNSKAGFSAGLDLTYSFNHAVSLKSGVEYNVMGAKDGYHKLSLGYLDVPVEVQINIYKGLYAGAGMMGGINVYDGRTAFLLFSDAKKCEFSIPMNIGYRLGKWVVDLRYSLGITKAYKDFNYKNRSLLITLGYRIPF